MLHPSILNYPLSFTVTNRDTDFLVNREQKLSEVMTTDLVIGLDTMTLEEANQVLIESKRAKLPVVNSQHELTVRTL